MQDAVPPRASYEHRPGRWVADPSWPSPNVAQHAVDLSPDRTAVVGPVGESAGNPPACTPIAEALQVGSAQAHGVTGGGRSCSYATSFDLAIDQRHDDAFALCFDSAPLSEGIEILGIPEAALDLAADRQHALVAVRVCDVAPDGTSTLVTRGVLNLTHRDSHEHPEPLEPHCRYAVRFPLHAIGYAIPAGHRIRVAITPTCWPLVWPSPEPVTLSVHPGASRVLLPVRETGATVEFPYPEPEQAKFDHEPLGGAERGTISRDLASGTVTVTYEGGGGFTVPSDSGAEMRYQPWERDIFQVSDADPLSARSIADRRLEIERGDWHARADAHAEMTADEENFHISTRVTTYSDSEQLFDRTWSYSIPRDHV